MEITRLAQLKSTLQDEIESLKRKVEFLSSDNDSLTRTIEEGATNNSRVIELNMYKQMGARLTTENEQQKSKISELTLELESIRKVTNPSVKQIQEAEKKLKSVEADLRLKERD